MRLWSEISAREDKSIRISIDTEFYDNKVLTIQVFVYRRSGIISAVERSGLLSTVVVCCQR